MILSTVFAFIRIVLAPIACFFDRHHRRIVLRNLKIAFPGMGDPARQLLAVKTFEQFFMNLLMGFVKIPSQCIQISGIEHLEACRKTGRGAVILLSHFGSWELLCQVATKFPQVRFSAIYQPLKNKWLNRFLVKMRSRDGITMLNRKTQLLEAAHRVKGGEFVAVFFDQHAGDHGMWVPFFEKLASTSVLPLILKGNSKAALIPAYCYELEPGRWKVEFKPEITPAENEGETLYRMHVSLENKINENPELYFWLHNRWKTPKRHIFFYHYRRGFYVPKSMKLKSFRILVRGVNWLGDSVLTIPALRALKTGRPDSNITLMVEPKLADFWKGQYYVDRVVDVRSELNEPFDLGIVLPNSFRSAQQIFQNEVEIVTGYAGEFPRKFMIDVIVPESCRAGFRQHDVYDYLGLADYLGAGFNEVVPVYGMLKDELVREKAIAIQLGASFGSAKRWFEENFVALARRFPEYRWLLIGGPEELEKNRSVARRIGNNAVAAETSLSGLGKLLAGVRCLVCNDSGPMHFAAAVGTPVVAIFGSTEPVLTGPLGEGHQVLREKVECSPCFLRECPIDLRCMKAVTVDAAEKALRQILKSGE